MQVHRLLIIALLGVLMLGCAPTYIKNTKVPNTPDNREIIQFVERYRTAIEHRDNDLLLSLVSPRYLENASTTDKSDDDYGLASYLRLLSTRPHQHDYGPTVSPLPPPRARPSVVSQRRPGGRA